MKMGDKAIVEVETISSGSLGIDLALGLVVTQEEELLKYTVQNHLERTTLTLHAMKLKSRWNCCFIDANMHSTEIMLKN
jgi:recombination protein RecA